jgi:hypothetical protein
MSLFSEIEKTIERGFRHWTERMFGPAQSDELILVHRAILEEIETGIQVVARGRKIFPHAHLVITLVSADAARRELLEAAFAGEDRLRNDIREALEGAGCEVPRGFRVDIGTAEAGPRPFVIEVGEAAEASSPASPPTPAGTAASPPAPPATAPATAPALKKARLAIVKGKAAQAEYTLDKPRTNIGRLAELTDAEQRVVRCNDVVFEDATDPANDTVSRRHAHIRLDAGEYRICDDGSEFGTRVFRDGRSIEVPRGNRRGERLRSGDEIYLGRAAVRFEEIP